MVDCDRQNMFELLQKSISQKFTKEVLEEILRTNTAVSDPTINNIVIGSETKKGESYMSVVTRFTVEISSGNQGNGGDTDYVHIIAKGLPGNIARRETFRSVDVFKNEVAFYNEMWPALDDFQKSKKLKNPINIVPKCFASLSDGIHDYVALEDLKYEGYTSVARNEGLSFDQAVAILKEFGRFHALSIGFKDQKPTKFFKAASSLTEIYFDLKYRDWYTPVMEKMMWVLRDVVEKELPKQYLDKLDELLKMDLFGETCKVCSDRNILSGITHGDCWGPNFLLKYDDSCQFKMKVIDYQMSRFSPVVLDLAFFLYICVEPSVRCERWDEFIQIYADTVSEFLEELGSNRNLISVDKVNDGMRKVGLYTLVMCSDAVIISSLDEEDVVDVDEVQETTTLDNVWIIKLITNENTRKKASGFFKHLVDSQFV